MALKGISTPCTGLLNRIKFFLHGTSYDQSHKIFRHYKQNGKQKQHHYLDYSNGPIVSGMDILCPALGKNHSKERQWADKQRKRPLNRPL